MDPRLLSPIQAGIRSFGDIQKGLLGQQEARQAGMETQFLPQQLMAALQQQQQKALQEKTKTKFQPGVISSEEIGRVSPLLSAMIGHPFKTQLPWLPTSDINQYLQNIFRQHTDPSSTGNEVSSPIDHKPTENWENKGYKYVKKYNVWYNPQTQDHQEG